MNYIAEKPFLIFCLFIIFSLISCSFANMKSIEKLTCADIAVEIDGLLSDEDYSLFDDIELQELDRTKTRLDCKGLSHNTMGEPMPIMLFAEGDPSDRFWGYETLPIEQWDCDDSAIMAKDLAKTYGVVVNDILEIEEVTPFNTDDKSRVSKIICKGLFIFDTSDREHLLFFSEASEEGPWTGFYQGESITYYSNEIHYLPPLTNENAQKLLTILKDEGWIDDKTESGFQIRKDGHTYEIRMPVKDGLERELIILGTLQLACILEESNLFGSDYQIDVLAVGDDSLTGYDDIITRQFCQ